MSRIHEALKKAELERGPAQLEGGAAGVAQDGSAKHNEGVLTYPSAHTVALGSNLRFENLVAQCAHPKWHPDPKANLFVSSSQPTHSVEPFRTLRSRLYQLRTPERQPLRIILVTSALAGEGKTFVAANLGEVISRQDQRHALLIDADLRRPSQHVVFQAPFQPGLADYLRGDQDEMAVIQQGQESNLCLIAGGQTVSDPTELLSSNRFKTLLERVSLAFDWIIIDSPPCLPVADARVIADVCDGVLLVVRAGSTPLEVAQKARQTFVEKKILGVVLNDVVEEDGEYSSYYKSYNQSS